MPYIFPENEDPYKPTITEAPAVTVEVAAESDAVRELQLERAVLMDTIYEMTLALNAARPHVEASALYSSPGSAEEINSMVLLETIEDLLLVIDPTQTPAERSEVDES